MSSHVQGRDVRTWGDVGCRTLLGLLRTTWTVVESATTKMMMTWHILSSRGFRFFWFRVEELRFSLLDFWLRAYVHLLLFLVMW